jgi:hypothetical protein
MVITSFGLKSVTTKGPVPIGPKLARGAFLSLGAEAVLELGLLDDRDSRADEGLRREPASDL